MHSSTSFRGEGSNMDVPYRTIGQIRHAAAELRERALGATVEYPVDLEEIVYGCLYEEDQLRFDDEQELGVEDGEAVLAKTLCLEGKILIHAPLKREAGQGRYRFTIGHELGHWILHRPWLLAKREQADLFGADSNMNLTSLNRSVFFDGQGPKLPPEEWQANRFAEALLIGADHLREEFTIRFGPPPLPHRENGFVRCSCVRSLSRMLASQRVKGRPPLRHVFGLTELALAIALEQHGLVTEEAPLI
jgi:hypothetical protein